jgi:hypothetical protein
MKKLTLVFLLFVFAFSPSFELMASPLSAATEAIWSNDDDDSKKKKCCKAKEGKEVKECCKAKGTKAEKECCKKGKAEAVEDQKEKSCHGKKEETR